MNLKFPVIEYIHSSLHRELLVLVKFHAKTTQRFSVFKEESHPNFQAQDCHKTTGNSSQTIERNYKYLWKVLRLYV